MSALRLAEAPAPPALGAMVEPDEDGFVWDVAWPRPEGPWPVRLVHSPSGEVAYGAYEPSTRGIRRVRPEEDPALPALRELLSRGRLVSYRPGRRATVRLTGAPPLYVKVVRPVKAAKLAGRVRALAAAVERHPGAPRFPELVEADDRRGMLAFREVAGRSLREEAPPWRIERLAASVVALHRIDAAEAGLGPGSATDLGHYVRLAADAVPSRARMLRAALQEVAALSSETQGAPRLVHGDLHDKNVLVGRDGVTLLDVDMAHAGDPAEDVGNFAAHLVLRSLQDRGGLAVGRERAMGFLEAYRAAGGTASAHSIRRAGARTLLRLACLYQFRRRWQRLTPDLTEEATRWARLRP